MKVLIFIFSITFLTVAQINFFPTDSLKTQPAIMTSLPKPVSLSKIFEKNIIKGFTTEYLFNQTIITASILDCGTETATKSCFSLLYNYVCNDLINIYSDSTIVVRYADTAIFYKVINKYVLIITTDTAKGDIAIARQLEVNIAQTINSSSIKKKLIYQNYKTDFSDKKSYILSGKMLIQNQCALTGSKTSMLILKNRNKILIKVCK